ncbi:exported protein of unknown function [Bradyrhizobium sp. ORS 285]|uniref:hypothetical protein n=1 Tax=Bradyrhizobium sp. ORS 285 TaxID=115808 RepID=UPI0002407273|nr:hypothetical protein [Bradyrhizobium sp. ORS 285]CCD83778.1 exported hypothetical protein [Bradyrhizobium sp. ORS 285]SMX59322.1 exported protein of unknown function [Bradyrhizobium sp. ORS 285]
MILFTLVSLLLLLAIWVALPLLPAILIYRLFPNAPLAASGPLAGLTINTGGAFAAYLIIFLLIKSQVDATKNYIGSAIRPYWEIRGEISLTDESGGDIDALEQVLSQMDVRTHPNILGHDGATFRFKVPEESEGRLPKIVISFPASSGWGPQPLPKIEPPPWWAFWSLFKRDEATIDPFFRTIDIGKVTVKKLTRTETSNSASSVKKRDKLI